MEKVTAEEINNLANAIGESPKLATLAINLKIDNVHANLKKYRRINKENDDFSGTSLLIIDGIEPVPHDKQRYFLGKALDDSGLTSIRESYLKEVASNTREAETRDQLGASLPSSSSSSSSSSTSQTPAVVQKNMTINISGSATGSTIAGGIVNIRKRANTDEHHAPVPTKLSKPELGALGEKGQDRKTSEDEESSDEEESDGLQPGIFEQKVKRADPREGIELNWSMSYEMDTSTTKRGMALIINNFEEVCTKKGKQRPGSQFDRKRVTSVFEQLGLECISCKDLTVKEMENELKSFQEKVDTGRNIKVAVIFIMSHGNETSVQGVDDDLLHRSKIRQCLMDMKSMISKPKVIFYQACKGIDTPDMVEADEVTMDSSCKTESDVLVKRYLTNNVDMYEASACSYGHLSFRDVEKGSWFVSYLYQELTLNAHSTDLDTMMERVTGQIAGKRGIRIDRYTKEKKLACQTPTVTKTLTKKLYFLPGYSK